MEMTKDSGNSAIDRDIRNLEAIMFAGFELCFSMLEELLAAQHKGAPYSNGGIHLKEQQRARFERIMNEARSRFFLNNDI